MIHLRIGCRTSRLATMQTEQAGQYIVAKNPGATFELVPFQTSGDRIAGSLKRAGGKGHFVRDVEAMLLAEEIDLAIHCLKDMPGNEKDNPQLLLAGFLPREDAHDVFISRDYASIADLPHGAIVGTSSPRRGAQLRAIRADLKIDENYRGSIDTRIRKVMDGEVSSTLLALAGLNRVHDTEWSAKRLDIADFLPSFGQGTLALQCLAANDAVRECCANASDVDTAYASIAERACLRILNGDCHTAVAGFCRKLGSEWHFDAAVYDPVNPKEASVHVVLTSADEEPSAFGARVAGALLERGGRRLLPGNEPA
jgi:hydroxymethylbilane synthase